MYLSKIQNKTKKKKTTALLAVVNCILIIIVKIVFGLRLKKRHFWKIG